MRLAYTTCSTQRLARIGLVAAWLSSGVAADAGSPPCTDRDGDGYFAGSACETADDCNDADPAIFPAAPELCDGFDNNCSGFVDDLDTCAAFCLEPNPVGEVLALDTPGVPGSMSVAWSGIGLGVAWHEHEPGAGGERIVFARLSGSGQPVGSPVELETATRARGPSIVWTGSEYGVAWWSDATGTPAIAFARLDALGQIAGAITRVTTETSAARWPSLVWTGAEYGVAWSDERTGTSEVFFTRIDRDGLEIGDDVQVSATGGASPILAWNGSGYGLAWTRPGPTARFARLDPAGAVQGPVVTVAPGSPGALTWTGAEYGMLWNDPQATGQVRFSRIDDQGSPTGASPLVIDDLTGPGVSLVWIGSEYGLAWPAGPVGTRALQFARMIPAGAMPGNVLPVTRSAGVVRATVVWTGDHFASVWIGQSGGVVDLYFAQVLCECYDVDQDGFTACDECDDGDATVHPLAQEVPCDGVDNDCNPLTPDRVDADGDGFNCPEDCDDGDPWINPGRPCDGLDDACNLLPGVDDCDLDGMPDECSTFLEFAMAWISYAAAPVMVRAADLDGDGGNDVIVSGELGLQRYANDGSGLLGPVQTIVDGPIGSFWAADLDDDGDVDLVANNAYHVIWIENLDGAEDFAAPQLISTLPEDVGRVYPSDMDGDGDLDVIYSSFDEGRFGWYENLGAAASFGPQRPIGNGVGAFYVLGADLDGDGDNDVLASGLNDSTIRWFENLDGGGSFGPQRVVYSGGSLPYTLEVSDFDADGDLDVVAAHVSPGSVALYRNLDGNGNFGSAETIAAVEGATWVHAADVDGDGDEDVLTTSFFDGVIAWHENLNASGTFAEPRVVFQTPRRFGEFSVYAADLDNDGDLDVASVNQEERRVRWFRNLGNDCNGNLVPDSCEADCNANGIPDDCDLRGVSTDCNANAVPDECESECAGACDVDGDGCREALDCDGADAAVWAAPGATRNLRLTLAGDGVTLKWQPPTHPGAAAVRYDVLRSRSASDLAEVDCLGADQSAPLAQDSGSLPAGQVAFYLVRVENDCPGGAPALGDRSDGTPRTAGTCP